MADVKGLLKKLFPFISAAAAFGGPLGQVASSTLGKALGVDESNPSETAIVAAYANATPEQRTAALAEEHRFAESMREMGFKHAEELLALANADVASARAREVSTRDITTRVLAYLICGAFLAVTAGMLFGSMKAESALAGSILGYIAAQAQQVAAYYFGSSSGSDRKTELLANGNHGS